MLVRFFREAEDSEKMTPEEEAKKEAAKQKAAEKRKERRKKRREALKTSEEVSGQEMLDAQFRENPLKVRDRSSSGHVFTEEEKDFIGDWIEFRNIAVVSAVSGIPQRTCTEYLGKEYIREETDRICRVRSEIRFSGKILTLDECEKYLTSCITDEGVPIADQLDKKDKLTAMKLLLQVKEMKGEAVADPKTLDSVQIEDQLKELSIDTIKALISSRAGKTEREEEKSLRQQASAQIPSVTAGEVQDMQNMSPKELLRLLDNQEKDKN